MSFTPRKAVDLGQTVCDILLNGDVIRGNLKGEFDMIDREHRDTVANSGVIGNGQYHFFSQHNVEGYKGRLNISKEIFAAAIEALAKDGYDIMKVQTTPMGGSPYSTYAWMIAG